jgi:hypothetical protein
MLRLSTGRLNSATNVGAAPCGRPYEKRRRAAALRKRLPPLWVSTGLVFMATCTWYLWVALGSAELMTLRIREGESDIADKRRGE